MTSPYLQKPLRTLEQARAERRHVSTNPREWTNQYWCSVCDYVASEGEIERCSNPYCPKREAEHG